MKDIITKVLIGGIDERLCQQAKKEVIFLAECASKIQNGVIVEIGRRKGGSLLILCSHSPTSKVYSIDSQSKYDDSIVKLLKASDISRDRYKLIVEHSQSIHKWDCGDIDLLFIDGNHNFNAAYKDLLLWVPRVKPGGLVMMHDISNSPTTSMPGPSKALKKYLRLENSLKQVKLIGTSQLLVKNEHIS